MTALQKVLLGTPPKGEDGDSNRTANVKLNANVDVLNTQATLTSSSPTALRDLTAADMGKRMNFAPTANSTSHFPAAATTGVDQIVSVHNLSTAYDITMDVAPGSGDAAPALVVVKPGELVTWETDGVAVWRTIGRKKSLNETVQGNLTVAGNEVVGGSTTVGGNVTAAGKVNGANGANLLFNGSAEFGVAGWSTANFTAGSDSNGTYWSNAAAINVTTEDISQNIAIGANVPLALSYMISTAGVTAGRAFVRIEAFNSSNVSLGSVGTVVQPAIGQGWAYYSMTGITPAGTTYVRVHRTVDTSPAVSAGGVAFARIKVERGTVASLYSQESSVSSVGAVSSLAVTATFRNLIHNARFQVNQRYVASPWTATANYQYTLDRWRVVTSGQQVSWAAVNPFYAQVTCPAGGYEFIVDGSDNPGGTFVINWQGTATCEMGPVGSSTVLVKGQIFAMAQGAAVQFRWKSGTLSLPQVEQGTIPTAFEVVPYAQELSRCERYARVVTIDAESYQSGGQNAWWTINFPPMRTVPANAGLIRGSNPNYANINTPPVFSITQDAIVCSVPVTTTGTWFCVNYKMLLSADL
ncbi:hypothetical protein PQQ65_04975 [Paraburkholderia strydomiana]|uniref:hypothetical protein n=1 Tax=Paraburkholderia strydomiana TaxID=1245417 RepID=UPI0038B762C7